MSLTSLTWPFLWFYSQADFAAASGHSGHSVYKHACTVCKKKFASYSSTQKNKQWFAKKKGHEVKQHIVLVFIHLLYTMRRIDFSLILIVKSEHN